MCLQAFAQEIPVYKVPDVIVTAPVFREAVPDAVVELPATTSKAATLDDALRGAPGVVVSRSGGTGQPSSLFLRGAASEHTLVLIDGVEVNDPSHPTGGFDFSTVDLNLVEKVEIFKGPQTLRFGAGAVGGVVNIVTKKGTAPKNIVSGRAGAHQTNQQTATRLGTGYSFSLTRFETAGISAARDEPELDGHRYMAAALRASAAVSDKTEVELVSRATTSHSELDYATSNSGPYYLAPDDPNYQVDTLGLVNAVKSRTLWTNRWRSDFTLSHFYLNRTYDNAADAANPATFHEDRHANTTKFENVNFFAPHPRFTLSIGPSYRGEQAKYSQWIAGAFTEAHYSLRPFFFRGGLRADRHKKFGGHFTYSAAVGVLLGDTNLEARSASAFKSPSLFQIYDPTYGNENLNPERVRGKEISAEQRFAGAVVKTTAFEYQYQDLIQFASRYQNVSTARTTGCELEAGYDMGSAFDIQAAYSYTDARNTRTGARLLRRPYHAWRVGAGVAPASFLKLRAEYRAAGSRPDIDALSAAPVSVAAYDVAEVSAAVAFDEQTELTASVENLFDRDYEEIAGYGTPGLGVYFGLKTEL